MQGRGSSLQRGVCHLRREQENGDLIELLTQQKLDDSERSLVKSSKLKNKLRKGLEMLLSGRKYHNSISKVKKHCYGLHGVLQTKQQERANWLYEYQRHNSGYQFFLAKFLN